MRKVLPFLVVLPLISPFAGKASDVVVNNSAKTEVSSSGESFVESEVITEINGKKTVVKSNQPGEIEISADEKNVTIKTSKGITPAITIDNSVTRTVENKTEAVAEQKLDKKKNLLYTIMYEFFQEKIVSFFKRFLK